MGVVRKTAAGGGVTTRTWVGREPMGAYLATSSIGEFDLRAYREDGIRYGDALDPDLLGPHRGPGELQQALAVGPDQERVHQEGIRRAEPGALGEHGNLGIAGVANDRAALDELLRDPERLPLGGAPTQPRAHGIGPMPELVGDDGLVPPGKLLTFVQDETRVGAVLYERTHGVAGPQACAVLGPALRRAMAGA